LLVSFTSLAAARNAYPPGPPYRSCGDTLKVFDIQQADTLQAPCHPATLDTVRGVRGIVTAFDAKASSYAFYIQNSFANGGHAWTGIYVLTGAANYKASLPGTPTGGNLAPGDSVVVYGTTQEFPASNGETEIEGPDAIQSTNDLIVRRISSGNTLPAAHVGTTHDFNWAPAVSSATAEPWEGCLVRINGPLKVARTQQGAGVDAPNFLLVRSTAPADSVLIDGTTLTTFATPPLGSTVDWVQGILNQRNSNAGTGSVNSYRIQLRDGNDVQVQGPPKLTDAYSIEDNKVRLLFDRKVDPVAGQQSGNYHLASELGGSTVTAAVLDLPDSDKVVLTITSVLSHGDFETVSFENLGSQSCPLCTGTGQIGFFQGVLTVAELQKPDASYLPSFGDRSRFAGTGTSPGSRMSVRGVGVQHLGSFDVIEDAAGGFRSGIAMFGAPPQSIEPGHKYLIAANVEEFGGETQLVTAALIRDEATTSVPAATVQSVGVLADTTTDMSGGAVPGARTTGEDYEGMLVRVNNVAVCAFSTAPRDPAAGGSFLVTNQPHPPADTILVSNLVGNLTFDADTNMVLNVTGVLHFTNNTFRICPRSDSDIELVGRLSVGDATPTEIALTIGPNPGASHTISFTTPRPDAVDLAVFDLQGRRLITLAHGPLPAGTHSRRWGARTTDGDRVGAGIYFVRLTVGNETRIARVVTLR